RAGRDPLRIADRPGAIRGTVTAADPAAGRDAALGRAAPHRCEDSRRARNDLPALPGKAADRSISIRRGIRGRAGKMETRFVAVFPPSPAAPDATRAAFAAARLGVERHGAARRGVLRNNRSAAALSRLFVDARPTRGHTDARG